MKHRLLVALVAFVLVVACRKTTPTPVTPVRDADAEVPPAPIADASTDSPARAGDASPPPVKRIPRAGVNFGGAEFGTVPGKHGVDYTWDKTDAGVDYFFARGFTSVRLPYRHERIQPVLKGPLDDAELARMKGRVEHATKLGATVILEPHNSYRHGAGCNPSAKVDPKCKVVTETEIGDLMGRLATVFKDNPRVQLESTNEPHDLLTEDVVKLGAAALKEVRRVGFTGVVLIPGGGWGGASHFDEDFNGTTRSSKALLALPQDDAVVIDAHLYLDPLGNGVGECVSPTIGVERLKAFVEWLRANGRRGVIGELGAIDTTRCRVAMTNVLTYLRDDASDVIDSWVVWAAGAFSFATIYPLSIGPTPPGQPEKALLQWYKPFLTPLDGSPARAGDAGP